ncbi:hypothetical protein F1559_001940 [Cyanidiococcus yangmingshanensis]|uniref:Rubisco LSMT substrate-binding domain-containing protein n=1 Tax=Cyanidiococcus yangmingshanensis TaxID=2690220 RepID=A0A7J7IQ19_9RHOD|nr:hypothetical protein F1559_001940 [Cyanidiococcus yangmingshanensis]
MFAFSTLTSRPATCLKHCQQCPIDWKKHTTLVLAKRFRRGTRPLYLAAAARSQLGNVELGSTIKQGRRGLRSLRKLEIDEVIASVGKDAVFPDLNRPAEWGESAETGSGPFWETAASLALQILLETIRNEESPWIEYVQAVCENRNKYRDQPLLWDESIQRAFRGTELNARRTALREDLLLWLGDQRTSVPENLTFSEHAFLRAVALVLDRGIWLSELKRWVLAPPLDECRPTYVEPASVRFQCSRRRLFGGQTEIQAICTRTLAAGTELYRRSEAADEIEFFLFHGFLETPASAGSALGANERIGLVTLDFEISHMDRFCDDKIDVLEMQSMNAHADDEVRSRSFVISTADLSPEALNADDNPVNAMVQFLRLLCLGGSDVFLLEGLFRNDVWGFMALPVSEQNERTVCELVLATCEERLQALDALTTLNTDALPADLQRVAQICQDAERSTLQEIMTFFRSEMSSLREKEYYHERRLRALDLYRPLDPDEIHDADATGFDQFM